MLRLLLLLLLRGLLIVGGLLLLLLLKDPEPLLSPMLPPPYPFAPYLNDEILWDSLTGPLPQAPPL